MVIKSFRSNPNKPGTVGNGPQAGGIAKSAGVIQSSAIALLAGLRVGFIDADSTTAATSSLVDQSRHTVLKLTDDADFTDLAQRTFAGFDLVFIDFGAAQLSNPETILPTLGIMDAFGGAANCALILNQIPHKTGLTADLNRIGSFFSPRAQIRIARHNIDGTGKFEDLPAALASFPVHYVDNFPPNVDDLWRSRHLLPSDLIDAPPPGYELATAKIALHLLRIAESGNFAEWLGASAAIPKLRAAAEDALKYTPPLPAEQLTNAVLTAYDGLQRAMHKVLHAHSDVDCVTSAREAQHYDREYRAARA
ncbi:ParA family protein [Sphingobium olei]|uniref:ParA family protein n=1 Tax=Sphingobium olei TaxID=420955 RepID=A0ABW3NWY0_9SPHN